MEVDPGVIEFVRRVRVAFVLTLALAGFTGYSAWRGFRGAAEIPPAYETPPLPAGLDSLTSFEDAARQIEECVGECAGIVYFWTPRMPLSRSGIAEIWGAAKRLGMPLTVVGTEDVYRYASAGPGLRAAVTPPADAIPIAVATPIADAMLRAGALAHAPAVVVHSGGQVVGHAILGYKTAETYEGMIARRLDETIGPPVDGTNVLRASGMTSSDGSRFLATLSAATLSTASERGLPLVDYEAVGNPGAYFRWVPGRQALAYESRGRIYLLDLADGQNRRAPGSIDFVPTPDGRYFVTPGRNRSGLAFFDADDVFESARADAPASVTPFFTDPRMRDQYPSVGILEQEGSRTVYRVLTSWYEGIIYRDYEVQADPGTRGPSVRPIGEPVIPCSGMSLSTPIMSQDGTEVAARDESTGTTKIFRILGAGRCSEVLDLGMQTTKVAWHQTGRLLAFARPRVRQRGGGVDESVRGVFLFDRDQERLTRLSDSDDASLFAFPDFIGDDSIVFLIRGPSMSNLFRVVDGIR
jgi:hypothetical protein